ncbi:unnamed protein product [Prunus brigantina]
MRQVREVFDGPGIVERAPHNTMHKWVGSNFQPKREDMGAFYSAARDPTFYAHQANIDRLWELVRIYVRDESFGLFMRRLIFHG